MKFHNRPSRCLLGGLISIALISSCSFKIERLDIPPATVPPSATLPVITRTATLLPTIENISTPSPQATAEILLKPECLPVEEKMPDDLSLAGMWVRNRGKPYLEPVDSNTAYGVPFKGGGIFLTSRGDMAISPDGRYLAYIDSYLDETGKTTKSRILRIINSSGQPLPLSDWAIDWQWLLGWSDSQHLAIFTGSQEILILEPLTGKWERLRQPAWLERFDYDYYGNDGPFYSPGLDRILLTPDYSTFELRDFQTGQTIYKGAGSLNGGDLDWSADGSTLAIGSEKLLHIITGTQQHLELEAGKFGVNSVNSPSLSPDGQKLVFTSSRSGKLFFVDIDQRKVTKLCMEEFTFPARAIWSPEGRFVVQEAYKSYSDQFDLLIDTEQLRAYKLISGQYQHRLVWLAEP